MGEDCLRITCPGGHDGSTLQYGVLRMLCKAPHISFYHARSGRQADDRGGRRQLGCGCLRGGGDKTIKVHVYKKGGVADSSQETISISFKERHKDRAPPPILTLPHRVQLPRHAPSQPPRRRRPRRGLSPRDSPADKHALPQRSCHHRPRFLRGIRRR